MALKKRNRKQNRVENFLLKSKYSLIFKIAYVIFILFFSFLFLELLGRQVLPQTPFHGADYGKYGWYPPTNTTENLTVYNQDGSTYVAETRYMDFGFKRWHNLDSEKPRVFIVGDSYTQSEETSNGNEYYSYLEKSFPEADFFVFGKGGYSSLQEFLVLNEHYDTINPDVVIWQFTDNDWYANHLLSEKERYPFSANKPRPYLINGRIVYAFPGPFNSLRNASKLFDFIMDKGQELFLLNWDFNEGGFRDKLQSFLVERSMGYSSNQVNNTKEILRMAKSRANNSLFIFFSVDPFSDTERQICEELEITCIDGVREYVDDVGEQIGTDFMTVYPGHWNADGYKIAGVYLGYRLKNTPEFMERIEHKNSGDN